MSTDDGATAPLASTDQDPVAILQNLQQLTDLEGDLADTAVAVVAPAAVPAPEPSGAEDRQAGHAQEDLLMQVAEGVENALEQSMPPAPQPQPEGAASESTDPDADADADGNDHGHGPGMDEAQAASSTSNALESSMPLEPSISVEPSTSTSTSIDQAGASVEPPTTSTPLLPISTPTPASAASDAAHDLAELVQTIAQDTEHILPPEVERLTSDTPQPQAAAEAEAPSVIPIGASADVSMTIKPDPDAITNVDVAPAESAAASAVPLSGSTPLVPSSEGYLPASASIKQEIAPPGAAESEQAEQNGAAPAEEEDKGPHGHVLLPEGLTEGSPSVRGNRGLVRTWRADTKNDSITLALFNWALQRSEVVDARAWYAHLAVSNPTAVDPLLGLINLESALSNFPQVERLFEAALKGPTPAGGMTAAADVGVWKAYLDYIRRQNPLVEGPSAEATRQTIEKGYEFALEQCGTDRAAGEIWAEYVAFVQGSNPKNHWETQAQQDALRKLFQRAVVIPLNNVEVLWKQYDAFESSINKQAAKKYLADKSPAYMTARTALRELRRLTDALPHPVLPPRPAFDAEDRAVVQAWKAYLQWEEANPLVISDPAQLRARVKYALRRCLGEMRHFPEMWHFALRFFEAEEYGTEKAEVLRAAVDACPTSVLLSFAAAEYAEEQKDFAAAHAYYAALLERLGAEADDLQVELAREVESAMGPEVVKPDEGMDVDGPGSGSGGGGMDGEDDGEDGNEVPTSAYARAVRAREERGEVVRERKGEEVRAVQQTMGVVWVMNMRFARRAEGIKAARAVFGRARKSAHVTWHPFEASALMEYHSNKDQGVAVRIFELGFKSFPETPEYVLRYVQFLLSVNDENNARALFERSTLKMPADKIRPLWELWARHEYMYGDLVAVHKLEQRWAEAFPNDSPLKRFAQRYKYDGLDEVATRDLGVGRVHAQPAHAAHAAQSQTQAQAHAQPQASGTPVMAAPAPAPSSNHPQAPPFAQPPFPPNALPHAPLPPLPPPTLPLPPQNVVASQAQSYAHAHAHVQGGQQGKRAHASSQSQSPIRPLPRGSVERSHSPSRENGPGHGHGPGGGGANKRFRVNSPRRYPPGPPPPPIERDRVGSAGAGAGAGAGSGRYPLPPQSQVVVPPPGASQAGGYGRDREREREYGAGGARSFSGSGPAPVPAPGQGGPGGYAPPTAYGGAGAGAGSGSAPARGLEPREGYDRSGVGKALAWFVGQLPSARSFDGPVFRPDDIVHLFGNIGRDGTSAAAAAPSSNGSGYRPPMPAAAHAHAPPPPLPQSQSQGRGGYGYAPPPPAHAAPPGQGQGQGQSQGGGYGYDAPPQHAAGGYGRRY